MRFNVSRSNIVLILIVILMGFYYVRGKLTNEMLFLFIGIILFLFFLNLGEKTVIDIEKARELTEKKAFELMRKNQLEGVGTIRILPESEMKKLLGKEKGVDTIFPYKLSCLVELSGSGFPTRYYLFEWSKYGSWLGITKLVRKKRIKEVSPELLVVGSGIRTSGEHDEDKGE